MVDGLEGQVRNNMILCEVSCDGGSWLWLRKWEDEVLRNSPRTGGDDAWVAAAHIPTHKRHNVQRVAMARFP